MTDKNKDALIAVASMLASAGLQGGSQSNPASPTRGSEDPAELMRMAMKKASTTPGHTTGKSDKSKNPHFQRFLCSFFSPSLATGEWRRAMTAAAGPSLLSDWDRPLAIRAAPFFPTPWDVLHGRLAGETNCGRAPP